MGTFFRTVGNLLVNGALINVLFLFACTFLPVGVAFRNFDVQRKEDPGKIMYEMSIIAVGSTLWLLAMFSSRFWWIFVILLVAFIWVMSKMRREGVFIRKVVIDKEEVTRPGVYTGILFDLTTVASSVSCAVLMLALLYQAASGLNFSTSVIVRYIDDTGAHDLVSQLAFRATNDLRSNFMFGLFVLAFVVNLARFVYESIEENGWEIGGIGGLLVHIGMMYALFVAFAGGWGMYLLGMGLTLFVYFLYTRAVPKELHTLFEFFDVQGQGHTLVANLTVPCMLAVGITPMTIYQWGIALVEQAQQVAGR